MHHLPDIQRTPDTRRVAIQRVGVTGVHLPVRLKSKQAAHLDTTAQFEMSVSLPEQVKGTHMSRFTEVLSSWLADGVFSGTKLVSMARELRLRLESDDVFVRMEMDYFIPQSSPVSARPGLAPLKAFLEVEVLGDIVICATGIVIEGMTCCPCSREISDFDPETGKGRGAHAQRGKATITVSHPQDGFVWFEELAEIAWKAFSQPVYPILKRPDERHVTMGAYSSPKFVEDVSRDIAVQLRSLEERISGFHVRVQNAESIHYHDAFAEISEAFGQAE